MQEFDARKDKNQALIWGFLAVALIPALVWFTRDRPLAADSLPQMVDYIRQREGERLDFQLKTPKAGNHSAPNEVEARWEIWKITLKDRGCTEDEAQAIIEAARKESPTSPIFIQRASLRNQQVWLVGGAIEAKSTIKGWIHPTVQDLEDERRRCTKFWLHAVSTEPPYILIDRFSEYR